MSKFKEATAETIQPLTCQIKWSYLTCWAFIRITLDTYSHVAPGLQQAAASKFDDIVLAREIAPSEKV
ncbi:hypothetical protein DA01_02930 [Dehalococcoides mccartyi]|uniref:Uncharacterized protein n=1 Tax=Dehalococcoides mccartyi TaxID=61435 RepID=A0A0V8M3Y3_9CHLR|nr:hypothetical protein [Dehalococcoides mccartyi]KSV18482.1 hypothetical protein DA01_02930 [Dehalococcoides mccartyi]